MAGGGGLAQQVAEKLADLIQVSLKRILIDDTAINITHYTT